MSSSPSILRKRRGPQVENLAGADTAVPGVFLDDDESTRGHIQAMIPYWIYMLQKKEADL